MASLNQNYLIFFHELWSPGERERFSAACTGYLAPRVDRYEDAARAVLNATRGAGRTVVAATGGTLCMCKLEQTGCCCPARCARGAKESGDCVRCGRECTGECALVDALAKNISLQSCSAADWWSNHRNRSKSPVESDSWWDVVVHNRVQAATAGCANLPNAINFRFDNAGVRHVNALMVDAVQRQGIPLLDMHVVTSGRCGTVEQGDGRHYKSGLVQLQISVLFEALLRLSSHEMARATMAGLRSWA